ncbi:MAG: hypothetical protein U0263_27225 [Polyangiaceae bacterium]
MTERVDLADPSCEPSDEALQGLAARAFAGVKEAHEKRLAALWEDIDRRRRSVLSALGESSGQRRKLDP